MLSTDPNPQSQYECEILTYFTTLKASFGLGLEQRYLAIKYVFVPNICTYVIKQHMAWMVTTLAPHH